MYTFGDNIFKFPRFFISVLLGFFLTVFDYFIKLLKKPKQSLLFITLISFTSICLIQVLKLMMAIN